MSPSDPPSRRPRAMTRSQHVETPKLHAARARRRTPTLGERLASDVVCGRGVLGLKFRREQIVAGYCTDPFCAALRLCIEIDGGVHDDPLQMAWDKERPEVLERLGIRVLRIAADDVSREAIEALVRPWLRAIA